MSLILKEPLSCKSCQIDDTSFSSAYDTLAETRNRFYETVDLNPLVHWLSFILAKGYFPSVFIT
jgi:hypothetical protein